MAETRVVITAEAEQAIAEYERFRREATGALEEVGDSADQLDRVGNSAAQTANAMGQVPAQFTDIIVSLQGGMSPLTVLLQQGGQLRDMFGGVSEAVEGLTTYVKSLITPVTAAVAVLVLVATAYQQGSKEADAYAKSIIVTGNAAGVTTQQLGDMAKKASAAAGTQGANAEVLAALVGTAKVGASELIAASVTAMQSQKYLGIAVEETVQVYADLGKDPLEASLKLTEQYGYLTLATYQQIKALEQEGRVSEAATVAQNAYSDSMKDKSAQVAGSLGSLQQSWNAVSGAAKSAWDFMLDIGRKETVDEKLKRAEERVKRAKLAFYNFIGSDADKQREKEEAERERDRLLNIRKVGELTAQYAAEDRKSREAAIQFDAEGEKYQSRRAKMEEEIAKARQLGQQAAPRGEDAAVTEQRVQERIAQIRSSYADLNNTVIESQIAAVSRLGAVQEEAARRARILLDTPNEAGFAQGYDQRVAYAERVAQLDEAQLVRDKKGMQQRLALMATETLAEDERAAQAESMADLRGQVAVVEEKILTRRAELTKELTVMDAAANRAAFSSLDKLLGAREADVDALRDQVRAQKDENAILGLTTRQAQAFNREIVEERAARKELEADILDTIVGREQEADALRESARLMRELNNEQIAGANKKQVIEANKSFWESVDRTAQSAFTNIFEGGKSAFDRLKDSLKSGLLDMLYQMTVRKWIINVGTSVSGTSGVSGIAGAAGVGGTGNSTLDLISMGKTIYQGFTTGFAGVGASLGGYVAALGNTFGSASVSAFGAGMGMTSSQAASAAAAYNSAGMASTGSAIQAGSTAGAAAGVLAGVAGGVYGGRLISGGYSAFGGSGNSAVNTGTAIGAAVGSIIPVIGTALGALIGGLLGGATNRLFGHKDPKIDSQGIRGTIGTDGITAETYANIVAKGGTFRSDKWSYEKSALDAQTDSGLDTTLKSMITSVKGFGKALGLEASAIDGYTKSFDIKLTGDAAKDNELVLGLLDTVGNELSLRLVPELAKFAAEGETLTATLQRLTTNYVAVDTMLGAIGKTVGVVGLAGIDARERLIVAAGGLDALASSASFFRDNFLTDAERMAPVQKQVAESLAAVGYASVTTVEQFKAAALGIDLTTQAGADKFAQLLAIAPAFKEVADYTAELAGTITRSASAIRDEGRSLRAELDELTMSQAQLAEKARAAVDASNRAVYDQVQAAKAVVSAKDQLSAAYDRESSAALTALDRSRAWVTTLNGLNPALAQGNLSTLTPEQKYAEARAHFEKTLTAANAGDTTAQSGLSAAEQAFLTASQVVNASDAKYAADYARVVSANQEAVKWASQQVDLQQASYDALKAQVSGLITLDDSVNAGSLTVAQAIARLQSAMSMSNGLGVKFPNTPDLGAAPVIDFSRYQAGSNVGSDALVAEIRALNNRLNTQTEEIKGLRADQVRQTGALMRSNEQANAKAADKVVDGVEKSAKTSAWNSTVKGGYA